MACDSHKLYQRQCESSAAGCRVLIRLQDLQEGKRQKKDLEMNHGALIYLQKVQIAVKKC